MRIRKSGQRGTRDADDARREDPIDASGESNRSRVLSLYAGKKKLGSRAVVTRGALETRRTDSRSAFIPEFAWPPIACVAIEGPRLAAAAAARNVCLPDDETPFQ